jgi:hypothetical protein
MIHASCSANNCNDNTATEPQDLNEDDVLISTFVIYSLESSTANALVGSLSYCILLNTLTS